MPAYWRFPRSDERYVVREFNRHITHCRHCSRRDFESPWFRPREGRDGSLCSRGLAKAQDLSSYLESRSGRVYSTWDNYRGESIEVSIDQHLSVVRSLLVAMEYGLRLDSMVKNDEVPRIHSYRTPSTYDTPSRSSMSNRDQSREFSASSKSDQPRKVRFSCP